MGVGQNIGCVKWPCRVSDADKRMSRSISLKSTKEAALYFDRVLPLDSISAASGKHSKEDRTQYHECIPYDDKDLAIKVVSDLVPELKNPARFIHDNIGIQLGLMQAMDTLNVLDKKDIEDTKYIVDHLSSAFNVALNIDRFFLSDRDDLVDEIRSILGLFLSRLGYGGSPTWGNP